MAFKINNLAKDLGMKSKEITELLSARGVDCKPTQALEPKDFDIVFEALTRGKQISNIDDYLFGDTYIPTVSEKKESKKAQAEAPKKEEAAAVAALSLSYEVDYLVFTFFE